MVAPKDIRNTRKLMGELGAVRTELSDEGVLTVTLQFDDAYERGTHTTAECFSELGTLFDSVSVSDEVRVVVLRGPGGGRRFTIYPASPMSESRIAESSGPFGGYRSEEADPALTAARSGSNRLLTRFYLTFLQMDQPVICSMNGDAIMATTTLVELCDIVLAAANARFGDPHTQMGLVAVGGPIVWPRSMSIHKAAEYLLTGELMTASDAERYGLVNHVYPTPEATDAAAAALASKLARLPTHGVTFTKRTLRKHFSRDFHDWFNEAAAMQQLRSFVGRSEVEATGLREASAQGHIPGWEYDKSRD
jgi:enoyl-CoA hydratase